MSSYGISHGIFLSVTKASESETAHESARRGTASNGRYEFLRSSCANVPDECCAKRACEYRNSISVYRTSGSQSGSVCAYKGDVPVTPPSMEEPPTCHFAMCPLLTSQISTASPLSVLLFTGATSGFSKSTSTVVPESVRSDIELVPNSAFDATASSHSYPGRHRTLRTGNCVAI